MIPEKELNILIEWSIRDDEFNLILKKDAPQEVVKIAKQFFWKPYDVIDGVKYLG